MKDKRGFTLIELLAVILILGFIMLIAIPVVNNQVKTARKKSIEATGNQMVQSANSYLKRCEIRNDTCSEELEENVKEGATLKELLEIKGDVPVDILEFVREDGEVRLTFNKDSYTCSNVKEDGTINEKGVVCGDAGTFVPKSGNAACYSNGFSPKKFNKMIMNYTLNSKPNGNGYGPEHFLQLVKNYSGQSTYISGNNEYHPNAPSKLVNYGDIDGSVIVGTFTKEFTFAENTTENIQVLFWVGVANYGDMTVNSIYFE